VRSTMLTTLTGLALTAGTLTATTAGTAYAAETCFGLTPTIVASDRAAVTGTEGDDVIVTTGITSVDALGGDDTLCVTDSRWISAGDGNDRVRSTGTGKRVVLLGSGSDHFEGSGARERIFADGFDGEGATPGTGPDTTDTISTRGGKDRVFSGDWSQPNHDEVDLGGGEDSVVLAGGPGGTADVDGGRGSDSVDSKDGAALRYDLAQGTASAGGVQYAAIASFENVFVQAYLESVTVRGTDGPNDIWVTGRADVDAGAGRDIITLFGDPESVVGGPGRDHVVMTGYGDADLDQPVRYDLRTGRYSRGEVRAPFETETLRVYSTGARREDVTVLGSPRRDVVTMGACGAVVRGRGGDDLLSSNAEQCERVPVTLYGGAGHDRLRGSVGRDVLIGNGGRDRAYGDLGRDRCRAEVERTCELD
jgi:Ca2+-binding RTX toxin-like protein